MNPRDQLVESICQLVEHYSAQVAAAALQRLVPPKPTRTLSGAPYGSVTAQIEAACSTWRTLYGIRSRIGESHSIDTAISNLVRNGRLIRRGARGFYAYRVFEPVAFVVLDAAE